MSWISEIFSSSVGEVVRSVGDVADKLLTSDKEKLELHNQLAQIQLSAANKAQELELMYEQEISKRHQNDMNSDSWLSKNIRPLTLIFILAMYSFMSLGSGFDFNVNESYVELLGQWGMLIMGFYFSSRGLEKIAQLKWGGKNG